MAHILVIDDEESIRFTFRTFLANEGHAVATAGSVDEALSRLDDQPPDLVFVDILLGGRSGMDLLEHIRAKGFNCPVVVITGEPSIETAAESVRLGAFDYIPKPVNKDSLLRITRVALRSKDLEDEKLVLEAEKERLRLHLEAIFRSVPDAIITVNRRMHVVQANQSVEQVLGLSAAQMAGRSCAEVFRDGRGSFCEVIGETIRTKQGVREYRVECRRPDGGEQTVVLSCSPLLDKGGEFIGAVLVVRDISRLAGLERELTDRRQFRNIVGKSPRMRQVYDLLERLAGAETTVLVTGPSGTGKELVAEALHYGGPRADKQLVKVNCSALPETLLETELFGHVRGAFTGAVRDKVGRFQSAHGGTIFLDEIGDLSHSTQLKLLRVLQEKEFERLGDTATIKVDVRVVAATNRCLLELVRKGRFREDLYYRLKVVEISLPPLAERTEDIPLLVEHFTALYNQQMSRRVTGVSDQVMPLFMRYAWPGNVRELKHALEHAFIIAREDVIDVDDLPRDIFARSPAGPVLAVPNGLDAEAVRLALERAGGNKAKAARLLQVSRQTLYRKIKEYSLS